MRILGLLLAGVMAASAGEFAVLVPGGSRLHVDRHESESSKVRLYMGSGFVELESSQVLAFEPDGAPPPTAPIAAEQTSPAPAKPSSPGQLADAAADKYGLPRSLVRSVMAAESAFQPQALSPKGAIGLMQLMPATAKALGADPNDPAQNVDAGTRYLRDLLLRYDGLLWHALAAYNAGPGAVDKYNDIPPYRETLRYVNRIDRAYRKADPLP